MPKSSRAMKIYLKTGMALWRWLRYLIRQIIGFFTGEDARKQCEGLTTEEIIRICEKSE